MSNPEQKCSDVRDDRMGEGPGSKGERSQGCSLDLCEELPQTVTDGCVFLTDERKGLGEGRNTPEVTQQVGVRLVAGGWFRQV